jgi:hypothetical protein
MAGGRHRVPGILPATAMQPVVIFAIAGFPVAIVLAWLFEVTPQREAAPVATAAAAPVSPEPANAVTPSTRLSGIGRGMRIAVLSLVVLGCGGIAYTVMPRTTLELLARIHDERGDLDAARERYNEFLALWGSGDRDVPEIASARERLEILGRRPRVGVR